MEENLAGVGQLGNDISITAFPDELLGKVFLQLDSVSRKLAERACSRWLALLRETPSLQKNVKIDIGIMLAIPIAPAAPNADPITESGTQKQRQLVETIRRLMQNNPTVETFHITDESNPGKPWKLDVTLPPGDDEECVGKFVLKKMGNSLFNVDYQENPRDLPMRLSRILLDKLVLSAGAVYASHFIYAGQSKEMRCIELLDVKVRRLSLEQLADVIPSGRDQQTELTRIIASGTVHFNLPNSNLANPYVQYMTIVGKNDLPLTAEESTRFREVAGSVDGELNHGAAYHLQRIFETISRKELTLEAIVDGTVLTDFEKRLVAGAKESVLFWERQADEFQDDDPSAGLVQGEEENTGEGGLEQDHDEDE